MAYPTTIDVITTAIQDDTDSKSGSDLGVSTTVGHHAQHHIDLATAVMAVETELGTAPKGPYATSVRNRFEILDWKRSCRASPVGNVAGTYAAGPPATKAVGGTTFVADGVTTANGDRVFLHEQTSPFENGIYQVSGIGSSVVLTRTYDADDATKLTDSCYISVEQGAVNRDTTWELVTDNPITVGTTNLYYTRVTPDYGDYYRHGSIVSGAKYESMPRMMASAAQGAPSSGQLQIRALMMLRAGDPVSSVTFWAGATAGASLTNSWAGLVRVSDRQLMAVSANNTAAAWNANTSRTFSWTAFTPPKDELYWVVKLIAGTTLPNSAGISAAVTAISGAAPVLGGSSNSGLTTPLAVGTIITAPTANNQVEYCSLA